MLLTLLLVILDVFSLSAYTTLVLKEIRPGYKLTVLGGIFGAFATGVVAVYLSLISLNVYLFFILCVTATGIALTKGKPASLLDFEQIYGLDDPERITHDKGIWKRQAIYLLLLVIEGAPVIYYAR